MDRILSRTLPTVFATCGLARYYFPEVTLAVCVLLGQKQRLSALVIENTNLIIYLFYFLLKRKNVLHLFEKFSKMKFFSFGVINNKEKCS